MIGIKATSKAARQRPCIKRMSWPCYLNDSQLENAKMRVGIYFEKNVQGSVFDLNGSIEKNGEWARFELVQNIYAPNGHTIKVRGPHCRGDDLNDPKKLAGLGGVEDGVLHFAGLDRQEDALKFVRIFFK